ncbi:MAG: thioredoxin-disulfide reductase [Candidatus Eisenbacteria bacterium]|nr:thioredoxin-disulfide reductase [Candidatus Eisenbacteria bacterium]
MGVEKVIILGSGPAGYTAALYTARARLEPLLVDGFQPGGQLTITTDVENYPGFPDGVMGPEMMDLFRRQAERFGTRFKTGQVVKAHLGQRPFRLELEDGETLEAHSLIICTGARAKLLGLENESKLMGRGVSACATCDGFFFQGKEIAVVGGGDTAMEEANFLTRYASKVTIIHRREEFRSSKIMLEKAQKNPKIEWLLNATVEDINGVEEGKLTSLVIKNTKDGSTSDFKVDGLFIGIGHEPNTEPFTGQLEMNDVGYIEVDGGSTRTSVEGVFAAGDVADHVYRQAVTAAGTGCRAAIDAERWLEAQGIEA